MPTQDTLVTPADRMNPLMTAADIMTAAPRTCSKFSTVLEAVLIFRDADCGFVPILEDGKPIGVLTDRDVALALIDHGEALPSRAVAEIMSRYVATVPADAKLDVIEEVLAGPQSNEIRRVPWALTGQSWCSDSEPTGGTMTDTTQQPASMDERRSLLRV